LSGILKRVLARRAGRQFFGAPDPFVRTLVQLVG
jgi:hypothetical protein